MVKNAKTFDTKCNTFSVRWFRILNEMVMTVYENYDVIAFKSCIQIFTVYCGLNIILTSVSNGRTSMKSCKASEFLTPSHRVDKTESSSCCYVFISLKPNGKFFLPLILIYIFLVRVLIENISPHCTAKTTLNWKSEYRISSYSFRPWIVSSLE